MRLRYFLWLSLAAAGISASGASSLRYPDSPRADVSEDYHGTRIADPYRWLEAIDSPEVKRWVEAQNQFTRPRLEKLPQRAWFKRRLAQLWNYEQFSVPEVAGGRYFYRRNDGRLDQSVLYVADSLTGKGRVLFDPNKASGDKTVSLARIEPSPDGKLLAYSLSDGGTDWEIWRFRRVADGVDLPDELRFIKFYGFQWARDSSGVWYSRYPQRQDGREPGRGDDQAQPAVYFHRLGEPQSADRLVYRIPDHPRRTVSAQITDDGRFLFLNLYEGSKTNGIRWLDPRAPETGARELFADWDAQYQVIGNREHELYVLTTQGAPNSRVIALDIRRPERANWREVVRETDMPVEGATFVGGRVIVRYSRDARGVALVYRTDGTLAGEVPVPGIGGLDGFEGSADRSETFFSFVDYLQPTRILRLDVATLQVTPWRAARAPATSGRYETVQRFYTSKDGTRVPMFITQRRGLARDGSHPVLLHGYGGFGVTVAPTYKAHALAWLDMGGVYVEANLRGGNEYGERWHDAGALLNKQNVFDDFIAAAEFLIAEGYTRRGRIAITGRSNGGLLVGAVMTQRPELFGAALPAVGVHDMLRYHLASANARQWSSDFGLSENPEQFAAQWRYSPVHNTRAGTCYPPTLVTTAELDDRVVPWHSYKFAASLQHDQSCDHPVLIRVETRAGHGAGKPVWMQIEDFADQLGFAASALGVTASRR